MTCDEVRRIWDCETSELKTGQCRDMFQHIFTCDYCDEFARTRIALADLEDPDDDE